MLIGSHSPETRPVKVGLLGLEGLLGIPEHPRGIVIFAHGSGSSRLSPRNQYVASALRGDGFATLLLDLLTPEEEADRANVFDIPLLAQRVSEAVDWVREQPETAALPIGLFGASTGAAAALVAAARMNGRIRAIVSRGGRADLAGDELERVRAPTLLIVGSRDVTVMELNAQACACLRCEKRLATVAGASHLFEEPGTLDEVIRLASRWLAEHLPIHARPGLRHVDVI